MANRADRLRLTPDEERLLSFYSGHTKNPLGYTLFDLWDQSLCEKEQNHLYIQWLFPIPTKSPVNPDAPTLTPRVIEEFAISQQLQEHLLISFEKMLEFYGFCLHKASKEVTPSSDFEERKALWMHAGNHNLLRITRILKCMTLLKLGDYALAFYRALGKAIPESLQRTFQSYWKKAVLS